MYLHNTSSLARGNPNRKRNAEQVMNNSKPFRSRRDRERGDLCPRCTVETESLIITIENPIPFRRTPSYHGVRE